MLTEEYIIGNVLFPFQSYKNIYISILSLCIYLLIAYLIMKSI